MLQRYANTLGFNVVIFNKYIHMEVNDLVAIKSMLDDDDRHGNYNDCYYGRHRDGAITTSIAAGFAALGIVIFGGLGVYAYANANQKTAAALANANGQRISDTITSINQLNQTLPIYGVVAKCY